VVTSIPADETIANVPNWQEDTNSPFTATSAPDFSMTVGDTQQDVYLLSGFVEPGGDPNSGTLRLAINGVNSGGFYDFFLDGTKTAGANRVPLLTSLANKTYHFRILIRVESSVSLSGTNVHLFPDTTLHDGGVYHDSDRAFALNQTELSSITLTHDQGADFDGSAQLIGRPVP